LVLNDLQHEKKSEIKRIKGLTSSDFCAIIYPVSERNTMTMTEIQRYWKARRAREAKRDTFTLNGNTNEVSHDPKHQADQLAGYCGNNPK
jgi:hypothetical protein